MTKICPQIQIIGLAVKDKLNPFSLLNADPITDRRSALTLFLLTLCLSVFTLGASNVSNKLHYCRHLVLTALRS